MNVWDSLVGEVDDADDGLQRVGDAARVEIDPGLKHAGVSYT